MIFHYKNSLVTIFTIKSIVYFVALYKNVCPSVEDNLSLNIYRDLSN